MYISKLCLVNYRNFARTKLIFNKGINTVIGENGSGKTNLFRAIRLLLDDNMIRSANRLDEADFHRGLGKWQGHWIIISLEFKEISEDESIQALFLHNAGNLSADGIETATYNLIFRPKKEVRLKLANLTSGDLMGLEEIQSGIAIKDYETLFTGRSDADFNDPDVYKNIIGDFERARFSNEIEFPSIGSKVPGMFSLSKEISFTYIQALRDVVSEFYNNRTNPLLTLLKGKSGEIGSDVLEPIIEKVRNLNSSIEGLSEVEGIRTDIKGTLRETAGEAYSPSSLSIKSDLPEEADKLFQSLKLFVGEAGEAHEGPISDLSLGGANLIFLTLKLLEFKYQKAVQSFANFLLIEEPEAHIHTHIQKTLFDKIRYSDTQIIYSTHSTHISEVSNVENMNVLGKYPGRCEAYQPSAGLTPEETGRVQRYLDAVRSNLLFAKSVILVEGDAEEILIPVLVKEILGLSLDELGISLVNIRSTGFKNVALLFHETRIRKKCSIVTDLDLSIVDTTPISTDSDAVRKFKEKCQGSQEKGAERKVALDLFIAGNPWVAAFYAQNTFEVDFVTAGNSGEMISAARDVYSSASVIAKAQADLLSDDISKYGRRALTLAEHEGKGWFAILLAQKIGHQTVLPEYILDAISFAHPALTKEVWLNVLNYRLKCNEAGGQLPPETYADCKTFLESFELGIFTLEEIKAHFVATFPDDSINKILGKF